MNDEGGPPVETLPAHRALEGFLSRMDPLMNGQVPSQAEVLPARETLKGVVRAVGGFVGQ